MKSRSLAAAGAAGLLALSVAACGNSGDNDSTASSGSGSGGQQLSGKIVLDGSSTVYPFAQAAAEQFQQENPGVKVTVGESGTGGGFEKFCNGETDIANASRPIKSDEEAPICEKQGVTYGEVQIADDGIAVVTNKDLKIDCMTVDQLKQLWNAKSKVKNFKELGGNFPDQEVSLYGAGTDSGTFDFFTEEINGEKGDTRKDYQPTEDDNVTVQGVSGDKGGLGYFGFSYFEANQDKLNLVGIDGGDGCKKPSKEEIQRGAYKPLSRPLFMYPSAKAIARPEVKAFMDFILTNYESISANAQIVPMTAEQAAQAKAALAKVGQAT